MDSLLVAIRDFVAVLDELELDYFIGGSVASTSYGDARSTRDVDFVLSIRPEIVDLLVERLEGDFYIDRITVDRAVETGDSFNALAKESIFQVDVFIPQSSPWIESQFARRQLHTLEPNGRMVYLCSPEGCILSKLDWYRLGNEVSQQQWRDVIGVLRVQGADLDTDYLIKWANELGVADLLARATIAARVVE